MSAGLRRAILYGLLAIALCGYSWVEGRASEQTAEAVDYGKSVLGGHRGFEARLRVDSLRLVALGASEGRFVASEAFWRHIADSLAADTLDTTGVAHTPLDSALQRRSMRNTALQYALNACDASREASDSARVLLATDLALCRARGDSLEVAVGRLLKVRAPRWGFSVGPALLVQPNGSVHAGLAVLWGFRW